MPVSSARFWIGTIFPSNETRACQEWFESIVGKNSVVYVSGQLERAGTTGRLHYQILVGFSKPQRRRAVNAHVGNGHWEPTRSEAARAYVHKDDTAVPDTRFEFGNYPVRRNNGVDWEQIRECAKSGKLDDVPPDIYVR